jgi:hypothetical protein
MDNGFEHGQNSACIGKGQEALDAIHLHHRCEHSKENPMNASSAPAVDDSGLDSIVQNQTDGEQLKPGDPAVQNGFQLKNPRTDDAWAKFGFCWGRYDAPEARPWVLMHAIVGICVIHYSISVSQSILYIASTVADSNQRIPALFNIRAGNSQLAVGIMVSIANFIILPSLGAVCDYTKYRYHVGCFALIGVCITEFITIATAQEVSRQPLC